VQTKRPTKNECFWKYQRFWHDEDLFILIRQYNTCYCVHHRVCQPVRYWNYRQYPARIFCAERQDNAVNHKPVCREFSSVRYSYLYDRNNSESNRQSCWPLGVWIGDVSYRSVHTTSMRLRVHVYIGGYCYSSLHPSILSVVALKGEGYKYYSCQLYNIS